MAILRFLGLMLLLGACDVAPPNDHYTAKCRKLRGHTVAAFSGDGYSVLICVTSDGRVLEP